MGSACCRQCCDRNSNKRARGRLTERQLRIRELGETFPFSDVELEVLYGCHLNLTGVLATHSSENETGAKAGGGTGGGVQGEACSRPGGQRGDEEDEEESPLIAADGAAADVDGERGPSSFLLDLALSSIDALPDVDDLDARRQRGGIGGIDDRRRSLESIGLLARDGNGDSSALGPLPEGETAPSAADRAGAGGAPENGVVGADTSTDTSLVESLRSVERPPRERARAQVRHIEGEILPHGFGERFRKAAFRRWDESVDRVDFFSSSAATGGTKNEMTRSPDKIGESGTTGERSTEEFFDALTRCFGRRGSRSALEIMFDCCRRSNEAETGEHGTVPTYVPPSALDVARADDLVALGFRLAIASFLLALSNETESSIESLDMEAFNPSASSLDSLAASLSKASSSADLSSSPGYLQPHSSSDRPPGTPTARDGVTRAAFIEWAEQNLPLLSATLPTFMHRLLFRNIPFSPGRQPFLFPRIKAQSSAFFKTQFSPRLFSFACMSLSLGGMWKRLYTSDSDGLSFNRLALSLLGYGGPTLLIVSACKGGIFGAFSSTAWKESKDFYGGSDCFLYQLEPVTRVFRPRGLESNFMYCNSEARSKGYDGLAHGIGFGGTTACPRLFISEKFEGCVASSRDMTFEVGALLPPTETGASQKNFEIESLEVWGVGGDEVVSEALGARAEQREITAANVRKAKTVDKAQFLDDFRSGLIESKAFKHREEMRGRADCDIDDLRKEK